MRKGLAARITIGGIFTAMALALGFFESLIPVNFGIPGVKMGLANIVTLTALFTLGPLAALAIQICRIFLSAFMFGNMAGLLYSLSGGMLSIAVMILFFKIRRPFFSIIGISAIGAVFHNIGQILMAAAVVNDLRIAFYLPVLLFSGVAAGILVGIAGKYLVRGLTHTKFLRTDDANILDRI